MLWQHASEEKIKGQWMLILTVLRIYVVVYFVLFVINLLLLFSCSKFSFILLLYIYIYLDFINDI